MQDFENGVFWNVPTPAGEDRLIGVQQRTTSDGTKMCYGFFEVSLLEKDYMHRLGWYSYRSTPKLEELNKNKYGAIIETADEIKHRNFKGSFKKGFVYMVFPTLKSPLDPQTMLDTVNNITTKLNARRDKES